MSRTPIRDQFRRRPATPTTVARTTTAQGRKRNVALGLVPSQGRGGVHGRHLNPSINQCTRFSCLGVPAPAGMSDWYENDATQPQKRLNATAPALVSPAPQSSFRRSKACPVPRYGAGIQRVGRGGTNDRRTLPATRPRFSYLRVPAPAGMSDWCESMSRTPIRDQFRRRPATPTTVARTTTAQRRKREM